MIAGEAGRNVLSFILIFSLELEPPDAEESARRVPAANKDAEDDVWYIGTG